MEIGNLCYYFPRKGPRGVAWISRLLKKKSDRVKIKVLADPFGNIIEKRAITVKEKRIWPITHEETIERFKDVHTDDSKPQKKKWKFGEKQ